MTRIRQAAGTRPRAVRSVAAVAVLLCVLLAGSCGEHPGPGAVWAGRAEAWLANAQEARRAGIPNLARFLTSHVVLDHRGTGGPLVEGREAGLGLIRDLEDTQPGTRLRTPVYLSPRGMVLPFSWRADEPFPVQQALRVMELSPRGLVREETASSLLSGRSTVDPLRDWTPLHEVASRYVDAHNTEDRAMTLDDLPRAGGPAVFGIPVGVYGGFSRAVLLLTSSGAWGCPGRIAVSLVLDARGAVVEEERYHRVDDARRCLDDTRRFDGWWTGMDVPDPVRLERTGTVAIGSLRVETWNSTRALDALVDSSLRRFTAAGLPTPRPRSVTFYDTADRCLGNRALAGGEASNELLVCFGEDFACPRAPCPPWYTRSEVTMLHELAHTWMAQNLGEQERTDYEQLIHLGWASAEDPWKRRAVERAASVVAWGLQERPSPPEEFPLSEAQLVWEFYFLTGALPLSRR